MRRLRSIGFVVSLSLIPRFAHGETIVVTPSDSYDLIEGALPGDEVVIAPGNYAFRVHLTQAAPPEAPIVIRAMDPSQPPVWDLSDNYVEDAPGSYHAGDRGRGCWQLSGATNIHISGLVIQECHTRSFNSAGMRYYNGSTGIQLKDILFRNNDNGLTGGTQDSELTAEFCEFDSNGNLSAPPSGPTHNIYIYGGTFALRYSYVHDPIQGQNFHVRAMDSTIEYNWFARPKSYAGDLMSDDDFRGGGRQTMLLRGNLIDQGSPINRGQIVAIYNDSGQPRFRILADHDQQHRRRHPAPGNRRPSLQRGRHGDERGSGQQPHFRRPALSD